MRSIAMVLLPASRSHPDVSAVSAVWILHWSVLPQIPQDIAI